MNEIMKEYRQAVNEKWEERYFGDGKSNIIYTPFDGKKDEVNRLKRIIRAIGNYDDCTGCINMEKMPRAYCRALVCPRCLRYNDDLHDIDCSKDCKEN